MADPDERMLDRYQLKELRGHGGMADVYVAFDPRFQRNVALKVFRREDETLLRRFVREAHLMGSLSHPHLMPVYDAGSCRLEWGNAYYIVMPLMTSGTLSTLLKTRGGALSLEQCCRYAREVASVLDYVHARGIIHRDIKSSNVLLDREGNSYLADFGIARSDIESASTQLTTSGNVLGTVGYIAPELFGAHGHASIASDLYAFGVLLYEMVTGHLPFTAATAIAVITMQISNPPPSPRQYVPTLSLKMEQVLFKALEKRPELRYQSATELAEAFCRAATGRSPERERDSTAVIARRQRAILSETKTSPLVQEYSQQASPAMQSLAPQQVQYPTGDRPAYQRMQPPVVSELPPRSPKSDARHPSWSNALIVALGIIAVLSVVGASVFAVVERPALLRATTTPVVVPAVDLAPPLTPLPTSAPPQATQTAQVHATATAEVMTRAATGTLLYSDPLTNASSQSTKDAQWDSSSNDSDGCAFAHDGYTITTTKEYGCRESGKKFQNFAAQVDMTIKEGYAGGLSFRGSADNSQSYMFMVDSKSNFRIAVINNEGGILTDLQSLSSSSAIKAGHAMNRLQVVAQKNVLSFYVNNVHLSTVTDARFPAGVLAFYASPFFSTDTVEKAIVTYSNLKVYAPAQ